MLNCIVTNTGIIRCETRGRQVRKLTITAVSGFDMSGHMRMITRLVLTARTEEQLLSCTIYLVVNECG